MRLFCITHVHFVCATVLSKGFPAHNRLRTNVARHSIVGRHAVPLQVVEEGGMVAEAPSAMTTGTRCQCGGDAAAAGPVARQRPALTKPPPAQVAGKRQGARVYPHVLCQIASL